MSLRLRLALAFLGVVLVPLILAAFLVESTVPRAARDQRGARLEAESASVVQRLGDLCDRAVTLARATVLDSAARTPEAAVTSAVEQGNAGWAVVRDGSGVVLAHAGTPALPRPTRCGAGDPRGAAIAGTSELQTTGTSPHSLRAVVGFRVDQALLSALRPTGDVELALVQPDHAVIAATDPALGPLASRPKRTGHAVRANGRLIVTRPAGGGFEWVLVASSEDGSQGVLPLVLVCALVVAACAAWLLGRRLALITTAPLADVSRVASQIADGDFSARVPVSGRDEVAELARAFNEMTERLQLSFGELQSSRDQLRRDLTRLGETLSSTHDLTRILAVILDTAVETLRAEGGAVFLTSAAHDLYLKVGRGLDGRGTISTARLELGSGAVGLVASTGRALRGKVGTEVHPDAGEPAADDLIAVPLRSSGRVIGVLALYDRPSGPFSEADLETISTFAGQASVAVDNVLLHQEAQRLSITDGLTGLSNYRAFQRQLAREVERALRFHRPLGLLLLDIDNFKQVNDTHGHQVGDEVLVELGRRLQHEVRDVDSVARYGGEELVVVLPETDTDGAALLAARVREAVRGAPFTASTVTLDVTVSIGVASLPDHGNSPAELIRAADEAMYAAKGAGRDAWRVAGVPTDSAD